MSTPTFNTRHTVTGKLQRLTEDQIRPFKNVLEIVPDDAKPFEPGLFQPGTVEERAALTANHDKADEPKSTKAKSTKSDDKVEPIDTDSAAPNEGDSK